jgi:hypothetical protein
MGEISLALFFLGKVVAKPLARLAEMFHAASRYTICIMRSIIKIHIVNFAARKCYGIITT